MTYIYSLTAKMTIDLVRKAKIFFLLIEKVTILAKYSYFVAVFMKKLAEILLNYIRANEYKIKLKKGKYLFYGYIYRLEPVEFMILKTYIKTNLVNNFIRPTKLLIQAFIFFLQKSNNNFCLYINSCKLNNSTIKNRYLLPFITEFLN